jgi:hypothetical protein
MFNSDHESCPLNTNFATPSTNHSNSNRKKYGPKTLASKREPLKNKSLFGLEKLEICMDIEAYVEAEQL